VRWLADTNVVLRWAVVADPLHELVREAVVALRDRGGEICVCPQIITEVHAVATRPRAANGLGMSCSQARSLGQAIEATFPLLPDIPDIHTHWSNLISAYEVVGRQVFDVRLVALMRSYGVTHLLTRDSSHFVRFGEITAVTPEQVPSIRAGSRH